jgi:uncharacterized protein (TIGR02646 family)
MRAITKGAEPASLTAYRRTPNCNYDDYRDKQELRNALVTEQRSICCYCMGRIHNDALKMKIEHWRSQRHHGAEQLNYRNLLGACLGGEGQPSHLQHCDTKKGDTELQWNPADPGHHVETRIRYLSDGTITCDDALFDFQLENVLNLNLPFLKNNRESVLDAVLDWWKREKGHIRGAVPRATFERERARRLERVGDLEPYCQIAVWWLDQRLARMPA